MLPERAISRNFSFFAAVAAVIAATALVYFRGLAGVFLFDDFANLPSLGAFGPVDNWTAFLRYITSGIADPTGRPLALLSFLIDARNWPADPFPFKRTNLVFHLLNGFLLALLLRRLGRALNRDEYRVDAAAIAGAALWMLHPLFVSTTLYVVQREAMLPATFVLLGLLGYCRGREAASLGRNSGAWKAGTSIVVATAFGIASKANGVLLPLLAWLVDALILSRGLPLPAQTRTAFARMRVVVLMLPTALVVCWLSSQAWSIFLHGLGGLRPWTIGERLLTEARIVCEYLRLLWLPHPYTAGLFNDAVVVSTGVLSPPTTLASIAFLAGLLLAAVMLRRRFPVFSLAICFYFAGHLLESSVIPLELYYEHRNYLPALLMFWPLGLWMTARGPNARARQALAFALPLLLAVMTFMRADLWGDAQDQALLWVRKNPDSPRAQAYAAAAERARGRPDLAAARTLQARVAPTEDIQVALNLIGAKCELGGVEHSDIERAKQALRETRTAGRLYFEWMSQAISGLGGEKACEGLGAPEIREFIDSVDANPNASRYAGWRQDNLSLRGDLALALHDPASALDFYNRALDEQVKAETALGQAARLGAAGYPAEGLRHLDHYDAKPQPAPKLRLSMGSVHAWLLYRQGFMAGELAHLRGVLEDDLAKQSAAAPPST